MTALATAIATHRALYKDELALRRLAENQPPTSMDLNTGVLSQEPASALGMTVAGQLLRRLGHPEGYGTLFPYAKALWLLKAECRRKHPHHRSGDRPYWRGSLCWSVVTLVVTRGFSPESAGTILKVDRVEPLLLNGFRFIESTLDDFRDKAEKRAREDEGHGPGAVPVVTSGQRHDQPGLHRVDCPKCRKEDVA